MNQQTKAPERIDLPGGYYAEPLNNGCWFIFHPCGYGLFAATVNEPKEMADFAAAMNASPAPVRSAEVDAAIKQLEAMFDSPSSRTSKSMGRVLYDYIAQLEQAGGHAVQPVQSDEDVARELYAIVGVSWVGDWDVNDRTKYLRKGAHVIARHRESAVTAAREESFKAGFDWAMQTRGHENA